MRMTNKNERNSEKRKLYRYRNRNMYMSFRSITTLKIIRSSSIGLLAAKQTTNKSEVKKKN